MQRQERIIEEAIESLKSSPGKFQRLVERYAYLTYPHRFNNLVPQGRNPSDVTVKGWPDIYSLSPDGRMNLAEATHSSAWPDHLDEDLDKAEALGQGKLAGFLFVAWDHEPSPLTDHKKINPRYQKLMNYRDRLIALGISSDNINFVFKNQFVNTLAQPRFAGILKEILGLPCHSLPFRLISQEPQIFGSARRFDVFAPAKEEYLSALVHRTTITDEVEERLEYPAWAWVRGRGATGKTVLAIQIALGYESNSHPAYYLNLATTDANGSDALDALTSLADDRVLFIIDNVHLNEVFARDVFNHWQAASMGSRLLLLGRDVSISDSKGIAQPLDNLRAQALTLKVTVEDLAAVFLRLARKFLSSPSYLPELPHVVLQSWHDLFGGDLIAFSAAVAQRIKQLTQSHWPLQAQDAAKYVQEAYLERASEAERLNLLRIAVFAQLEVDVPREAIELAEVRTFLRGGLVHRLGRGRDERYEHYHLVHPGLGNLLLTAIGYSAEELDHFISEQFRYVARRNPFVGIQIAIRLESASRSQEAISILRSVVDSNQGLVGALIASGLQYLKTGSERLARLRILSESEIDQRLVTERSSIYQAALRTPLSDLALVLQYTEEKLPGVYAALTADLAQPQHFQALTDMALRAPPHMLAAFLEYAEHKLPRIYAILIDMLAQPENSQTLSEIALHTPLANLALSLQYAVHNLPGVYDVLTADLAQPENVRVLSKIVSCMRSNQLAPFLESAELTLTTLTEIINDKLAEPKIVNTIAAIACLAPLDSVAKFLQTATVAPAVVLAIDRDEWDRSRLASRSEKPHSFPELARTLQRLGRPELAEAPARALISAAEPKSWHVTRVGLYHLSHVMRLGRAVGTEALLRFLARVATPAWLEEQYKKNVPLYGIAAALFSLWGYHEQLVLDHFRVEALKSRLIAEMRNLDVLTPEDLSAAIQLLGCSALIGVYIDRTRVRWPEASRIREVVSLTAPKEEMATIGHIQIQLWLGLREMARMWPDHINVQAALGDQILSLWRNSAGYTNKQNVINGWMIDWLERCAQSGWQLIPDEMPFAEAVASREHS